ncbi:MAG: YjjG family noncanonical pyrimidine nucleotidase [Oscillospiraceae bacterium]
MAYNCLLLDFDETLVSFQESELLSITKTYEKYKIPTTKENTDFYSEINAGLWRDFEKGKIKKSAIERVRFQKVIEKFNVKNVSDEQMNRDYLGFLRSSAILLDGALEFLQDIEEHVTIAIVTNGIDAVQQSRLKVSGVADFVDGIFTSEKVGANKPDKRIFMAAMKTLGIETPQKVLVVGDNIYSDIKGGINAGLDTCWVNFKNETNTTDIKPKYTVYDFTQLKNIILE